MTGTTCPCCQDLIGYSQGTVSRSVAERIAVHVADCERCLELLDELCLIEDKLIDRLGQFNRLGENKQFETRQFRLRRYR